MSIELIFRVLGKKTNTYKNIFLFKHQKHLLFTWKIFSFFKIKV